MESDDEDPFCYKSLQRTRRNQDCQKDYKKPSAGIGGVKKNTKLTPRNKAVVPANKKRNRIANNAQKLVRSRCGIETEASACKTRGTKYKDTSLPSGLPYHRENTTDRSCFRVTENLAIDQQERKHNCLKTTSSTSSYANESNDKVPAKKYKTKPTQKQGQVTTSDKSDANIFQNVDPTCNSDIFPKEQALDFQIQTDLIIENVSPTTSDLSSGKKRGQVPLDLKDIRAKQPKYAEAEEGRCPFCQMPFQALAGQTPNWHTMECMDVPLKTTEECPAGLMCNSTIPGHYRRYTHSLLALHFAGQHQETICTIETKGSERQTDANEKMISSLHRGHNTDLGNEEVKILPAQKQQSKAKSSPGKRKRKLSPPKSTTSEISLSQGSQSSSGSNSSIKAYFSPSGKKSSACGVDKSQKTNKDRRDNIKSDPVLRLLVISDCDSDDSIESITISEGEKFRKQTSDDELDCDVQKFGGDQSHVYETNHNSENVNVNNTLENTEREDCGSGVIIQEADDNEDFTDNLNVNALLTENTMVSDITSKTGQSVQDVLGKKMEEQQSLHISRSVTVSAPASTSTVPPAMQKQVSLFSFFKPKCHSASTSKKQMPRGTKVGMSKLSSPRQHFEQNKDSFKVGRKPPLTKSSSEPVKLMRVPSPPPSVPVKNVSAFRHQASGHLSAITDSSSFQNRFGRQCPFYKRLTGTAITVDAFSYGEIPGCQAYVLTHFHYDHYQGLTKQFSKPMYCSPVTANLVQKQIGVNSRWINRLPLNTPCKIAGVWLTLMEANHCPGAVIILFELPNGKKLLHTGDFRADPCMEQYPPLVNVTVDELYLDTTYCDPAYAFPSQKEAIQFAVSTALKTIQREPSTVIVCGAYTIGKERIFIALAEALQTKVCVQSSKKQVLDCLEDDRLKGMVSLNWSDGCVHVLPMRQLNAKGLGQHLQQCPQFSSVLAFEPTGWTHSNKALSLDNLRPKFSGRRITVYGVPYSEHSSFLEMKRFVQFLRPKKILPTVNNGNPASRKKMEAIFRQWLSEGTLQAVQGSAKDTQQSLGGWLKKRS